MIDNFFIDFRGKVGQGAEILSVATCLSHFHLCALCSEAHDLQVTTVRSYPTTTLSNNLSFILNNLLSIATNTNIIYTNMWFGYDTEHVYRQYYAKLNYVAS